MVSPCTEGNEVTVILTLCAACHGALQLVQVPVSTSSALTGSWQLAHTISIT
jgi:hypothetical protein